MTFDELLSLLVCPRCRGNLTVLPDRETPEGLACEHCGLVYPVREGIPVMLVEEAVPADSWPAGGKTRS